MKQNAIIVIDTEDFYKRIMLLIREELCNASKLSTSVAYSVPGLVQKPLYKASEVCTMFGITRQTLHSWNKDNILKPRKIKSRTFYLWADIEKLIIPKDGT